MLRLKKIKVVRLGADLKVLVFTLFCGVGVAWCVQDHEVSSGDNKNFQAISDPFESLNRKVFALNFLLDRVFLKPIAQVYDKTTPVYMQSGFHGVLDNLKEPVTFLSYCAQGQFGSAAHTLMRFIINSTFGIAGFLRLGESLGVDTPSQNFGHALAFWGVAQGPYLMLPVLGPSSPRDLVSKGVNIVLGPTTFMPSQEHKWRNTLMIAGTDLIDLRTRNLVSIDNLEKTSLDLYVTVRSMFDQKSRRHGAISSLNNNGFSEQGPEPQE